MVVLVLLFVLAAIAVAFTLAIGLGPLAIIPFVIALAIGIWGLAALARGKTPGGVVRRTHKARLLGPGGPDDPEAGT